MSGRKTPTTVRKPAPAPPPEPSLTHARPHWYAWLAPLLIGLATLYAYSNATKGAFIFDDHVAIRDNPNIRSLWPIGPALFSPGDTGIAGRPLVALSFAINYAMGGLDPWIYHVTGILIHLLAGLAMLGVVRLALERAGSAKAWQIALATALIWAVHPLQTETVTYITNRSESMFALFALLTAYCFLRGWLVLSAVCCVASVCCKEVGAMVPPLIYLTDVVLVAGNWKDPIRLRWRYYASLLLTWVTLPLLLMTVTMFNKTGGHGDITPFGYLLMQTQIITTYLKLCFWPDPLLLTYVGWPVPTIGQALPYALLLIALFAATVWLLIRRHPAGLIGACLFLVLAPSSSILPLPAEPGAERRMYLPLVGIVTGVLVIGEWLLRRMKAPRITGAIIVALGVIGLGQLTLTRNADYNDPISIWADTAAKAPWNPMAKFELGGVLQDTGNLEGALECYDQTIALWPNYPDPRVNRANILATLGRVDQAMQEIDGVLQRWPTHRDAATLRAHLFTLLGRRDEAIRILEPILRQYPNDPKANFAMKEARGR